MNYNSIKLFGGFPGGSAVKYLPVSQEPQETLGLIPGLGRFPWRRAWQLTKVFLPGESHGQRSLAGYNSLAGKELDTTEATWHACVQSFFKKITYICTCY